MLNKTGFTDIFRHFDDTHILQHRQYEEQAGLFAVFRQQRHPFFNRRRRRINSDRHTVNQHFAAIGFLHAEQAFHHFAAPGPHQPRHAEDLPAAHAKVDIVKDPLARQVAHGQHLFANGIIEFGKELGKLPPDHPGNQRLAGKLGGRLTSYPGAVAKYADLIGNGENFIHLMANINNGFSLLA